MWLFLRNISKLSSNTKYCGKWLGRMDYLVEVRAGTPLLEVRVDLWR